MMYCFAKFCRLCLEKSDSLLDCQTKDEDNISLINKINTLMPSLIISNDNYPTLICDKCQIQLNNSYKFFKDCFKTKQLLFKYNLQLNFNGDKVKRDLKVIVDKLEGTQLNEEGYIKINALNQKQTNNFTKTLNNKDKGFVCKTCGKCFSQIANLECHLKDIHLKIRQDCKICKKSFTQVGSLKYHERGVHLDIRNRICEYCEYRFPAYHFEIGEYRKGNDEGLNEKNVQENSNFNKIIEPSASVTSITEKRKRKRRFRNTNLKKRNVHLNIYKHKCRYCQHKFWSPKLLKYHLEKCKYRKESATDVNLDGVGEGYVTETKDDEGLIKNDPITINNNDRNNEEIILIESEEELQESKTTSNRKKASHVCKACGQFFPRLEYLEHHFINTHLKIKYNPFDPKNCQKTFTELSSLHYLNTNERNCEFCKLNFQTPTLLKYHLKNCQSRGKITPKQKTKTSKKSTPKQRKYNCGACTNSFVSVETLKRHIRIIHLRIRHECDICHKSFTYVDGLNYHKHVFHSNIRGHKCDYCGRQFWQQEHVTRHHKICKHRRRTILNDDEGPSSPVINFTSNADEKGIITLNENINEELQKIPTFEEMLIDKIELKTEEIDIE